MLLKRGLGSHPTMLEEKSITLYAYMTITHFHVLRNNKITLDVYISTREVSQGNETCFALSQKRRISINLGPPQDLVKSTHRYDCCVHVLHLLHRPFSPAIPILIQSCYTNRLQLSRTRLTHQQ